MKIPIICISTLSLWLAVDSMETFGSELNGYRQLGSPGPTAVKAMNPFGTAVVGFTGPKSSEKPFRWDKFGLVELPIPELTTAHAEALSDDGIIVVGTGGSAGSEHALRWNQQE